MSDELLYRYCPTCARDSLTEAPPCCDGHGSHCPERVCVECGTALTGALLGAEVLPLSTGRAARRAA